ncbi:hypothetical protein [Massilia sp. H6]|uniref:hypothetical protein n=1 Tax=Massilia sp. H6 TaxID=2970464 RepID=UPI00216A257D|nr:hypothetical protein [Massilia sp. H6]UVW29198.1 hypothetical protein NRS07_03355 [Massilia sp. H6]
MNSLANGDHPAYLIELNGERFKASSFDELNKIILKAEEIQAGRLWVGLEGGARPLWHRVFGLKDFVNALLVVEWFGENASLIFYDENWSEYRVLDNEIPEFPDEIVRSQISHGEQQAIAEDECMRKERAFIAIYELIKTRHRPTWLTYRFVR